MVEKDFSCLSPDIPRGRPSERRRAAAAEATAAQENTTTVIVHQEGHAPGKRAAEEILTDDDGDGIGVEEEEVPMKRLKEMEEITPDQAFSPEFQRAFIRFFYTMAYPGQPPMLFMNELDVSLTSKAKVHKRAAHFLSEAKRLVRQNGDGSLPSYITSILHATLGAHWASPSVERVWEAAYAIATLWENQPGAKIKKNVKGMRSHYDWLSTFTQEIFTSYQSSGMRADAVAKKQASIFLFGQDRVRFRMCQDYPKLVAKGDAIEKSLHDAEAEFDNEIAVMLGHYNDEMVCEEVLGRLVARREELDQIMTNHCESANTARMAAQDQRDTLMVAEGMSRMVEENTNKLDVLTGKADTTQTMIQDGLKTLNENLTQKQDETMGENGFKGLKDTNTANHNAIMGDQGFAGLKKAVTSAASNTETNVKAEIQQVATQIRQDIGALAATTMLGTAIMLLVTIKLAH